MAGVSWWRHRFFLCVVQSVFMYAKCLLFQFIKKKKRLIISGKVIRSVLPLQYCSTSLAVLQYFPESTGVLPLQYCGTFLEVLVL